MRRLVLLVALAAPSCAGAPDLPPASIRGAAGAGPVDQEVVLARLEADRGEPRAAIARLERVLAAAPEHVDARRLRQDLLRQRGRHGLLLHEARQQLAARPQDPIAMYLYARVAPDPAEKRNWFERAVAAGRELLWPWLGLAHSLREQSLDGALRIYERLYAATGGQTTVAIAYAAALRDRGRLDDAAAVYRALRRDPNAPGVGDLGLAQVAMGRDERGLAWTALLEAVRQRPFDPVVVNLLRVWLTALASQDQAQQVFDLLREDWTRVQAFRSDQGTALVADLLLRHGQLAAARAALEARVDRGGGPEIRQRLRRLLAALGDLPAFAARLAADIPLAVVGDESNEVRGRWLKLLRGPLVQDPGSIAGDAAVACLEALRDTGMLAEAEALSGVFEARWPDCAVRCRELGDEVRRQLAFEAGLRRLLYSGYQARDSVSLANVLGRLRELSNRVFGRDVIGAPQIFSAPLVGEMIDPFSGPFARHLARYNRHLVLGRRSGSTPEGLLLTRLVVRELPEVRELDLPGRCFEVVGIDRDVRSLGSVLGGDLAGVALLNHFLIDYDAVREWAAGLAERRRIAREDGLRLIDDPLPADVGCHPLDVAFRLALQSPVPDDGLDGAVLELIRLHERQHLVDAFRYLPIEHNLWRGLGLLFSFGWSASAIEAEMERRAELAALALSDHQELVLAHVADFLADPEAGSPHHRGFAALAEQLAAILVELGVPRAGTVPSRWHLLDRDRVQHAALRLLGELR